MLHTVNKSPFERDTLVSCVKSLDDDGIILLIEDGVIGATNTQKSKDLIGDLASSGRIYALTGDLEARGVADKVLDGVKLIDYNGFVDLVIEHEASSSWL